MEKFFNNAGPQLPNDNYTLDPLKRIKLDELQELIDQRRYFILHAPRQTGKTTALYALMRHVNAGKQYRCLYVNIEPGQAFREDVQQVVLGCCSALASAAQLHLKDDGLKAELKRWIQASEVAWTELFTSCIAYLSANDPQQPSDPRPLIIFVDEIDALIGDSLISILRQIRAGYADRPHAFAHSMILCGVRDVRDYRIHSSRSKEIITGGSAFNIKAESIRLGNFSEAELNELYDQHTTETGQIFTPEARQLAWNYTEGQPWLVNALAYDATFRMKEYRDRKRPITAETMREAKERMIVSRVTHLDQLTDKLQEERVYNVIAPLIENADNALSFKPDDLLYCFDLGLVVKDPVLKQWRVANEIYREVIPRELTWVMQESFSSTHAPLAWYKKPDGTIDMPKLLEAFQQFYREHSEHWLAGMQYREAGPQLLLQAYLQRVINGGGRIEREYGLGRGRTDLFVTYPVGENPKQREVIEIKLRRAKQSMDSVIARGTEQTREYMDRCKATQGHLFVFETASEVSWEEKISCRAIDDTLSLWTC